MPTNFELGQKLIQILKALFINFRALKVVKWATMLPAAANPVSVDPSKYGTKRKGSEEVVVYFELEVCIHARCRGSGG